MEANNRAVRLGVKAAVIFSFVKIDDQALLVDPVGRIFRLMLKIKIISSPKNERAVSLFSKQYFAPFSFNWFYFNLK
jgi:hypothetical protein